MTEPLLATEGLAKSYGAVVACDRVSLTLNPGEVHAVIGPNGAGKTTLLGQLAGELSPDAGRIRFAGADITHLPAHARAARGLGRSFQVTSLFPKFSALDNVALAVQAHDGHSYRFWRPVARETTLAGRARAALARVGLGERAAIRASALAHGEQRQLEIAMALAGEPRALLLDEPTAGMGREDSARMIDLLASIKTEGRTAILLIEHDMDAVFQLADRITVLVYGRVIASGSPAEIRSDPEVRRAYLGEEADRGEGQGP